MDDYTDGDPTHYLPLFLPYRHVGPETLECDVGVGHELTLIKMKAQDTF